MGGASVHLLDLAAGAVQAGHQVVIYVGGIGVVNERAKARGLQCQPLKYLVREISPWKDLCCFFELRSVLKKYRPDIVHLHSSKAGIIGRLIAKSLGIPSVFTAHGWSFTEGVNESKRNFYRAVERFMARLVDKVITVSRYDHDLALQSGVGSNDKFIIIHNGMPEISVIVSPRKNKNITRFVMVARFDEPKDQKLLVDSFSSFKRTNWVLELIGDGPFLEDVRSHTHKLGIADKIIFSGACNDVPARLANADVFCLISNWEGFPLTILEAMRGGLPVIASDVGGVSEAVIDSETGYLVPRGDKAAIVSSIQEILTSEEKRQEMGRNGRERFEKNFTFEIMLEKTIGVYQEVLGSKK